MKKLFSFILSIGMVLSIGIVPAMAATTQTSPKETLKVNYIDVGQADSIFIELPNKQTMLIDAGTNGAGSTVVKYIKDLGYSKLDYVIGTHPHEDHIGGLDDVINTFTIGKIYMPKVASTTKTFEDVLTAIQSKKLKVTTAKAGVSILNQDGLTADILAPVKDSYKDLNNYSAVIKLTYGTTSYLFMGDAEIESENQITANVKADVLKVGHHGSDSSTSQTFLKKVSPKYAVISVGQDNRYGHPAQATLNALQAAGVTVYRTDVNGTIIMQSDGKTITINKKASPIKNNAPPTTLSKPKVTTPTPTVSDDQSETVYVTETGKKYHREGCRYLKKSKIPISLEEAKMYYEPCSACNPPE